MSRHYLRASMLYEQSRFEMAEKELQQGLLADPENAEMHALLALILAEMEQYEEATQQARIAIHHAPYMDFAHHALARVYLIRNHFEEAMQAITEAIRLDPEDADHHAVEAAVHMAMRNWGKALDAAVAGLEIDPEDAECANLRAMALVKMGRKKEAQSLLDETLSKVPEDDIAHANKGWTLLHRNQPQEAMEHFREALRLNPCNEWSKAGMIEALKARYFIYRWMLVYFLWMSNLSHKAQWGLLIGFYVAAKFLRVLARREPEWQAWIYPILILYIIFVFMTWVAYPLFNLLLRLNSYGKHLLTPLQITASNLLLVCLSGALISFICGYGLGIERFFWVGGVFLFMSIPVAGTCNLSPGWPKKVLTVYTLVLALMATITLIIFPFGDKPKTALDMAGLVILLVWVLGIWTFGWLANALAMIPVRK